MPPKTQKQARFLRHVAGHDGGHHSISSDKAKEIVSGHPTKGLPARAKKKKG